MTDDLLGSLVLGRRGGQGDRLADRLRSGRSLGEDDAVVDHGPEARNLFDHKLAHVLAHPARERLLS